MGVENGGRMRVKGNQARLLSPSSGAFDQPPNQCLVSQVDAIKGTDRQDRILPGEVARQGEFL
jgi:hypothetical protein